MNGYELHKSGARVRELLERHFIVPTLTVPPTEDTRNWEDGTHLVDFRIGELCRIKENEEWIFYRLIDISDNKRVWEKVDNSKMPDMSKYYTKEEVDEKIEESVSAIVIPEDKSIENVTEDEYNAMFEANVLSDKTMYFVSKDGSPIALYIGKVQIAVREEGSKGFAYNFPIIF